jgi:imipenem/basic amino acid-specific outer membrane pore
MKKIIVSAAAAVMALSTTASALEDIKVNGQTKVWYETSNTNDGDMFGVSKSSAEVVFKLGMTGKQGDVGFGTTVYQTSTMGLEGKLVGGTRSNATGNVDPDTADQMFVGEAYFTAPIAPDTVLKFGKQELDTPLAFTERWNSVPNTFNAAVALNSSVDNLTMALAYVGQGNTAGSFKVDGEVDNQYFGGAYALAALYKADALAVNFWGYHIENALSTGLDWYAGNGSGVSVEAAWLDAAMTAGPVNVKGYAAYLTHDGDGAEDTYAAALSAGMKVADINLFAAASYVNEDGDLPVANTATNFKKTKLPTAGVYTDGLYVAQPGSTAFKVKASTKLASTGLALQIVNNTNSGDDREAMGIQGFGAATLDTTEVDLIVSQKVGVFNLKGILLHRMMDDNVANADGKTTEDLKGGQHVRVIASVNF